MSVIDEQKKEEAIAEALAGNRTVKDIAEAYGFNYKSFARWVQQAKSKAPAPSLPGHTLPGITLTPVINPASVTPTPPVGETDGNLDIAVTIKKLHQQVRRVVDQGNLSGNGLKYAADCVKILNDIYRDQPAIRSDEEELLKRLLAMTVEVPLNSEMFLVADDPTSYELINADELTNRETISPESIESEEV